MSTDELTKTPRKKPGRPKMPAAKTAALRLTVRLYGPDERALRRLMKAKNLSESEAIRFALRTSSKQL